MIIYTIKEVWSREISYYSVRGPVRMERSVAGSGNGTHFPLGITIFRDGTGRNGAGQLHGLLTNLRDGTELRKLPILWDSMASHQ